MDDGLKAALDAAGGRRSLAQIAGVSVQAVAKWKRVPVHHARMIKERTGLALSTMRPDVWRRAGDWERDL